MDVITPNVKSNQFVYNINSYALFLLALLRFQPCKFPESAMNLVCKMPSVKLPKYFVDQLNVTDSGFLSNTVGAGIAAYVTEGQRADVYMGLKLDGVSRYQNISEVAPRIKFRFAFQPNLSCEPYNLQFNPSKDFFITIKVVYTCFHYFFLYLIKRNIASC